LKRENVKVKDEYEKLGENMNKMCEKMDYMNDEMKIMREKGEKEKAFPEGPYTELEEMKSMFLRKKDFDEVKKDFFEKSDEVKLKNIIF